MHQQEIQYYAPDMNRLNALLLTLVMLFGLTLAALVWAWSQL